MLKGNFFSKSASSTNLSQLYSKKNEVSFFSRRILFSAKEWKRCPEPILEFPETLKIKLLDFFFTCEQSLIVISVLKYISYGFFRSFRIME